MKIFYLLLIFSVSAFSQSAQELCKQLVGDGSGKDAKARTTLMKMTHTAAKSDGNARAQHESIILNALKSSTSNEISTFLIQQLDLCGSKASLPQLARLFSHSDLGQNAARTFTNLAKSDPGLARELIINEYKKQPKPYLLNAISVMKLNDSTALEIHRSSLGKKDFYAFALQGLAQAGNEKDSKTFLEAFSKGEKSFRGKAFRLNLVYTESLSGKNKTAANAHLSSLRASLSKKEIPFITGIASVDFKINGVSDSWIDSLPKENIHTQVGIIRLFKANKYAGISAKLASKVKVNPQETVYLDALAQIAPQEAAPFVMEGLKSSDVKIRTLSSKLAINYGGQFATSLLKALIVKGEATKADTAMAKSMVSPVNINEVTKLWENLNPSLSLAFIEVTGSIQNKAVAAKMLNAAKSNDKKVQKAALKALKNVVSKDNFNELKTMLANEKSSSAVRYLQAATSEAIAQSDEATVKALFSSLYNTRNDKLLSAFAKSNRKEVLPLLKKDLLGSVELQKETIRTLSSMAPELSASLLVTAIEKAKDDRNKILAARALAEAATNSKENGKTRKAYIQKALAQTLPENEKKLLSERLKKIK